MNKYIIFFTFACILCSCTTILKKPTQLEIPEKSVILSFDDGPCEIDKNDVRLLQVLKNEDIHAYFCLIGRKIYGNGNIITKIIEDKHVIVFHSMDHEQYLTKSYNEIVDDIKAFEELIKNETGISYSIKYIRPPMGVISMKTQKNLIQNGYRILYASHNPTDTFINSLKSKKYIDTLVQKIINQNGGILVLHNGSELFSKPRPNDHSNLNSPADRSWIPYETKYIIDVLKKNGFSIIMIPD